MNGTPWERITERGSLLGLRFTVACYRLFGRTLSLPLIHLVVAYFFATDRAGRRASLAYLQRIAAQPGGRAALGREPGLVASFLHYRAFGLSIFDRVAFWLGRDDAFEFSFPWRSELVAMARAGQGAILLGAHLGSFDALRILAERDRIAVNVLMFTRNAPLINAIFRGLSPDVDLRVIQAEAGSIQTAFTIRSCIERGEFVAILGDRVEPGDRGRTCRVDFLGAPAEFPNAPFLLAALLGCPVVLLLALRSGPGRYDVIATPLAERVELPRRGRDARAREIRERVAEYAAQLEAHCTRAPYQWFNFFDFWDNDRRVD